MFRRSRSPQPLQHRSWSAPASAGSRVASLELVDHPAPPAAVLRVPDRVSVWPAAGGRYGIDAHYRGTSGGERAAWQQRRLAQSGLLATLRTDERGAIVRLGPLGHDAVRLALAGFMGRSLAAAA
jgi:hypothetical protein